MISYILAKRLARGSVALTGLLSGFVFSNPALAQEAAQLVIQGVDVDYAGATLYISGENFTNGSNLTVKMAGVQVPLLSSSDTELAAPLPVTLLGAVGSYPLTVSTGTLPIQHDVIAVTLGASGREDPLVPWAPKDPRGTRARRERRGPREIQARRGLKGRRGTRVQRVPSGLKGQEVSRARQGRLVHKDPREIRVRKVPLDHKVSQGLSKPFILRSRHQVFG